MANLQYLNEIKIILTMVITSRPSSRAISKGIQNDRVFPAPVGAHPITSLPAYNARAVLTWYQQGRFPKNSCTELRIFLTVHSRVVLPVLSLEILVEAAVDVLIGSHTTVDFPDRGFFFQNGVCDRNVTLDHMVQSWDPTLGLINDFRDPRVTFPAAALSRA